MVPSNMTSPQFDTFVSHRRDLNGDNMVSRNEWNSAANSWF